MEASRPVECAVGVFMVSKLSGGTVGFGDFMRWDETRETGRLDPWEFRGPVTAEDERKNDMVEIHG